MPPHEQPRPADRAPEQQRPPQERAPEQPRTPQEPHVPAQEHARDYGTQEQGPGDKAFPSYHGDLDEPVQHHDQPADPGHQEHTGGRLDERYVTDENYRYDDPAGAHRIDETFLDTGRQDPVSGELRHEQVRREALALRDVHHPGMSDAGAYAVHAYTRQEMVGPLNHAQRFGGQELADLAPQARALQSGLNELPPHVGPVSRRIDFHGDAARLETFMARYHEGAHIVEPAFLSSSKIDAEHPRSSFPGEVEMRVDSRTGRDVQDMASIGREREVLFKAGTQLEITGVEMGRGHPDHPEYVRGSGPGGTASEPKWIVHAEEVTHGDPRHLGEADANRAIDERRTQERADEARFQREADEELERFYQEHPELRPNKNFFALLGEDPPPPAPEPYVPATREPEGGWSELAKPLTPGSEPVLHAGSTETPQQQARLLRDAVPGIESVNARNYYAPEALEHGHRTNSAESLVAFENRMNGQDAVAAPSLDGFSHQQSLAHVGEQLGGQWSNRDGFHAVANELGERPVGARTAVAYETHVPADPNAAPGTPNAQDRVESRMVAAVKTEHGIVFADPRTGRLAELPQNATGIKSMPLGGGEAPHRVAETPAETHSTQQERPHAETSEPSETQRPAEEPPAAEHRPAGEPDESPYAGDDVPHDTGEQHPAEHATGQPSEHHEAEPPGIADRLNPETARPPHDENYLFDSEHRGTPGDHESIRRACPNDEIYDQVRERALARRDNAEGLRHMTDDGAVALHGFTRGEYAYHVNEANRIGQDHPGFDLAQENTRAIMDGLGQVPRTSGETVRGIDVSGDPRLAELIARQYEPGQVAVEPTFTSSSIKTDEFATSKFGDDVELHIKSDNIRDISKLAENPGEREALSPPGTQLLVHEKRLVVTPEGKRKWVIEAEEIGPGHPRYLDPETAKQKMAERRAENQSNAAEAQRRRQASFLERLDGTAEPQHVAHEPAASEQPTVHDVLDGQADEPVVHDTAPEHDFSELSRSTNPPYEAAIHAGTASPEQNAAYVRERHPHLGEGNPHFNDPGALENGYRSNCVPSQEAYIDRLHGIDATAEPIRMDEMGSRGTLDRLEGKFGGSFSDRPDYDAVIREMREQPLDQHAIVAVKYTGPNGVEYGHVAMVVHTREGVAFIDPQSGGLMRLPHPPNSIKLMHVGVHDPHGVPAEHVTHASDHASTKPAEPVDPRIAYARRDEPFGRPGEHEGVEVRPSKIGPDGRPVPSLSEHGGYGAAEPTPTHPEHVDPRVREQADHFLARDDVATALAGNPHADFIRQHLAEHPGLLRAMTAEGSEALTRSLLHNPKTIRSLIEHPEAIPLLEEAVKQAHDRGFEVIHDVEEAGVSRFDPTPEQAAIAESVAEIADAAPPEHRGHESFDQNRKGEPGYAEQWVAEERANWRDNQDTLNRVVDRIAEDTGGTAGARIEPKEDPRALAKIRKYGGDGSQLTDLVGAKIQFKQVADLYRALDQLRDSELEIVSFEDRIENPKASGYRDLQLGVRLPNGHVAELRLHLTHIDNVAAYEHALFEVRRDFETFSRDSGRDGRLSPEEAVIEAALTEQVRDRFEAALQKGLVPESPEENA